MTPTAILQKHKSSESRPEARLHSLVSRKLEQHPYFRYYALELEFEGSTVIINGRLPSFYLKQMLQELLKKIPVISGVNNQVEVASKASHTIEDTQETVYP